ncbi:MAG: hypothetical protein OSJ65_00535 [Bacilli bacterium]|nr:hypothetical protein [Bacilli bacterium]
MTGSEIKFYKIDDQNFIFSVKAHDTGAIRYYQALLTEDGDCNVRRIRNSFNFLSGHRTLSKVLDFTPDYAKIVTSLINYCETYESSEEKDDDLGQVRYFKLLRDINDNGTKEQRRVSANCIEFQAPLFYEIDSEDKMFITSGIANNNSVNIFKLK